jgi:hypothetical protein
MGGFRWKGSGNANTKNGETDSGSVLETKPAKGAGDGAEAKKPDLYEKRFQQFRLSSVAMACLKVQKGRDVSANFILI